MTETHTVNLSEDVIDINGAKHTPQSVLHAAAAYRHHAKVNGWMVRTAAGHFVSAEDAHQSYARRDDENMETK